MVYHMLTRRDLVLTNVVKELRKIIDFKVSTTEQTSHQTMVSTWSKTNQWTMVKQCFDALRKKFRIKENTTWFTEWMLKRKDSIKFFSVSYIQWNFQSCATYVTTSGSIKMTCPSNVASVEKRSLKQAIETGTKASGFVLDAKLVLITRPTQTIAQLSRLMNWMQIRKLTFYNFIYHTIKLVTTFNLSQLILKFIWINW